MRSVQEMDDGTKRIRPLLHISKDRLLATCTASSIPYVIDPSNSDLQYDRNRVRYGVKQIRDDNLMNTESILDVIDYLQVVCLVLPNDCQIRDAEESVIQDVLVSCCEYNRVLGVARLNANLLSSQPLSVISSSIHSFIIHHSISY